MAISLEQVRFSYTNRVEDSVIDIDHWQVDTGEKVFICGPSGSGKSTLLNLLSGLLKPTSGSIEVLGQSLQSMSSKSRDSFRASHIGYVFQQFNLIPYLSPIDNVKLGAQFGRTNKRKKITLGDIKTSLERLNIGQDLWNSPSRELSVGQQQRVAIARAIIKKPELLIVDEPTSSLDTENRDSFMDLLFEIAQPEKTTLLFVSHDHSLTQRFQRVDHLSQINPPFGKH